MDPDQAPRCNPSFLGPLTTEPEMVTGPVQLFVGEERYLSKRKLNERERLWNALSPQLETVLAADETVLYILPVLHVPRVLDFFGFGVWWSLFFRAALVLTDRRLVEIMTPDWKKPGTRICSYSWGQVRNVKISMGTLTLRPGKGRTQRWKLPARGDRKLLKLLIPRIIATLPGDIHIPRSTPLFHCPICGTATPKHPDQCKNCETVFKTQRLAGGLALAFPGAGLFYAGHPILATFDLLGEGFLYMVVASVFLSAANTKEMLVGVVIGCLGLFFTKLESAHLSTVLVKRTKLDPAQSLWKKVVIAGGVLSAVLIALPPLFSGVLADRLDSDLDFRGNSSGFSGGFDPSQWQFGADQDQRSEWIRDDGQALFVFSMPFGSGESPTTLEAYFRESGDETEFMQFAGHECLRTLEEATDEEGNSLLWIRWYLFDTANDDVHLIMASVWPADLKSFGVEIEQLVLEASWIPLKTE
ncbi:MAG: hypothetical protein GY906_24430 [bacterium]|nr:hypothetical protein [bacterium]